VHQSFVRVPVENSLEILVKKKLQFAAFFKPTFSKHNNKSYHNAKHTFTSLVCIMHAQNWLPSVNIWNLRVYHPIQCLPLDA